MSELRPHDDWPLLMTGNLERAYEAATLGMHRYSDMLAK